MVGRFDILHSGHFNLLSEARMIADQQQNGCEVVVALDTDKRISAADPKLPIFDQYERMHHIEVLRVNDKPLVDRVVLFETDDDLILIIKTLAPDLMFKGSEWKGKKVIGENLTEVYFYKSISADGENKISSSDIIKKILSKYEVAH